MVFWYYEVCVRYLLLKRKTGVDTYHQENTSGIDASIISKLKILRLRRRINCQYEDLVKCEISFGKKKEKSIINKIQGVWQLYYYKAKNPAPVIVMQQHLSQYIMWFEVHESVPTPQSNVLRWIPGSTSMYDHWSVWDLRVNLKREYFFGSPKLLYASLSCLFSSLKLLLHCFCSPPHCFYSLCHWFSFSSVARCSSDAHSFTELTHFSPKSQSDLCESSNYPFWCMILSFSPPDQAPRQKWRFSGSADEWLCAIAQPWRVVKE